MRKGARALHRWAAVVLRPRESAVVPQPPRTTSPTRAHGVRGDGQMKQLLRAAAGLARELCRQIRAPVIPTPTTRTGSVISITLL
jgi:hypothetical protein